MKRRQDKASLPVMRFTLAGQQPVAEDAFCFLQGAALAEIGILRHQHVADVIRMFREEHLPVHHLECDEVSVTVSHVLQESQWIPSESYECGRKPAIGAGR